MLLNKLKPLLAAGVAVAAVGFSPGIASAAGQFDGVTVMS